MDHLEIVVNALRNTGRLREFANSSRVYNGEDPYLFRRVQVDAHGPHLVDYGDKTSAKMAEDTYELVRQGKPGNGVRLLQIGNKTYLAEDSKKGMVVVKVLPEKSK